MEFPARPLRCSDDGTFMQIKATEFKLELTADLHRWRTFVAISELGSLTRASLFLDTNQSLLSRQLNKLERECGARLFNRTGRGVELSEIGQRLLPQVKALLASAMARQCHLQLAPVIEADSQPLQKSLVAHEHLYTVLPLHAVWSEVRSGMLQASRIVDPPFQRTISMASAKSKGPTREGRRATDLHCARCHTDRRHGPRS